MNHKNASTILVVDDNPTNLKLAVAVLESEGYRVVKAMDAEEAQAVIRESLPDLILMDIALPGMDGLTLTRKLRADPATQPLRIVAMTAFAMKGDEQRAIDAGCNGYITKPIDTRRLAAQVAEYLQVEPGRPLNVLIVDDTEPNRKLLRVTLQAEGLNVFEAGDGVEALAVLERQPIDAIISDILMPTMDGYRLCYEVRRNQRFQSLPVIFYTNSDTSPADEKLAKEVGANVFLSKPASAKTLLDTLAEVTAQRERPQPPVIALPQELELMKEYSSRLVAKLEEQNVELSRREQQLAARERHLRAILDSEPECVMSLAADGMILEMNRAGLEIIEAERGEQVLGTGIYPLVVPEYRPAFQALTERVFRGESGRMEFEVMGLKGGRRWLETNATPLRDESGKVLSLLSVTRDITDRKRTEQALSESEGRLQQLVQASNIGLWDWNLITNEVFLSPEWKRQLGYADDEMPNRFEEWERRVHPEDLARTLAAVNDFRAGRRDDYDVEFRMRHKEGSWRWILTRADLRHDADGLPIRMMGCHVDITEHKRASEELAASRERLELLSRQLIATQESERRHLARELHDEIGQALTGIKLNLNALQQPTLSPEATSLIHNSIDVVDQTLQQARNLALDLRPSMLDDIGLVAALNWCLDRQSQRGGFAPHFVVDPSVCRASQEIETACFRIAQESLTNIARHAKARNVRMELRQLESELELFIQDDGIGFDVPAARLRAIHGASIGLLGMSERTQLLGGHFEIESIPSQGTTIHARIPLKSDST